MGEDAKRAIRENVWRLLDEMRVSRFPKPIRGRIPNFIGAEEAADALLRHYIWRRARVVKVNPDAPQRAVRLAALREGKRLVVPTPRMRDGFLLLDPLKIERRDYPHAATIAGSYSLGEKVEPDDLPEIDLVVMGSVAVSRDGWRLGKGEGYAEIEYAVLRGLGKIGEETPIATTIHEYQLVDSIPHDEYDVPVEYIFTNKYSLHVTAKNPKPKGIIWERLPENKLDEIPLLRKLLKKRMMGDL